MSRQSKVLHQAFALKLIEVGVLEIAEEGCGVEALTHHHFGDVALSLQLKQDVVVDEFVDDLVEEKSNNLFH